MPDFLPAQPRRSGFFFRLAPGIKLAALFALSLIIFFTDNLLLLSAFCFGSAALYFLAGFKPAAIARHLFPFIILALLLALFQFFAAGFAAALPAGLRLLALLNCAAFVNAATASGALLNTLERALRFFAPLGLNARKTALAIALTLRFMPLIRQNWQEARAAQIARASTEKLHWRGLAALFSAALFRLAAAHEAIAEAIEARGFDDSGHE